MKEREREREKEREREERERDGKVERDVFYYFEYRANLDITIYYVKS